MKNNANLVQLQSLSRYNPDKQGFAMAVVVMTAVEVTAVSKSSSSEAAFEVLTSTPAWFRSTDVSHEANLNVFRRTFSYAADEVLLY